MFPTYLGCLLSLLVPQELPAEALAALESRGFRVAAQRVTHRGERVAADSVREATKLQKDAKRLQRDLREIEQQLGQNQAFAAEARELDSQLNLQLAQARGVAANNQIVARLNVLNNERQKLFEAIRQLERDRAGCRREMAGLRDRFFEVVRTGQQAVAAVTEAYDLLASEPACQQALQSIAAATGTQLKTTPPSNLAQHQRKLEQFAAAIQEETLVGTTRGNTLMIPVRLGDSAQPLEMIVDSGASIVCLPAALADQHGISIPADAPRITLRIADGSEISARQVLLPEVRVGAFIAKNVEAAVLGPEATTAPPLLGMSFLGRFNFSIDLPQSALILRALSDD